MPFEPRLPPQILRDLLAKVLARTNINDINVGSTLFTLLNSISHEFGNTEARMFNLRQSYALENASGSDLDERVAELPPVGIARIEQTNASGSVLRLVKFNANVNDEVIIPAGAIVQRATDGEQFEIAQDYVIPAGTLSINDVYIVARSVGTIGNSTAGTITQAGPDFPERIETIINDRPLTNGLDEEGDESLRQRALRYIRSLNRTTPQALEFLGRSFISSTNTRFPFATLAEDEIFPALSYLLVDDGTGENSLIRDGRETNYTIDGSNNNRFISHDHPATQKILPANIRIRRPIGGNLIEQAIEEGDYVSIHERGLLIFNEGFIQDGDEIRISDFQVFTGPIAEIQAEVEGNVNNRAILTGFRAAGTRVIVKPPEKQLLSLDVRIALQDGQDQNDVIRRVEDAVIAFINNLDIGETFFVNQLLINLLQSLPIQTARFFDFNDDTEPQDDIQTQSPFHVLRTDAANVRVRLF